MNRSKRSSRSSPSDTTLVLLLRERSAAGLMALYDHYGQLVYSVALHIVGDQGTAEEITQDVMLRCWNGIEHYDPQQAKFATWLLSITHHRAIDEVRSRRGRERQRSNTLDDYAPLSTPDTSDAALLRINIQAALHTLPPEQREVIELIFWHGLSRQEIAERLGLPLGTVHTRLRLGMQKLRVSCTDLIDDD